jgi:hypothetical protein
MGAFLFQCPVTGMRAQGWLADSPPQRVPDTYESIACPACSHVHLVSRKTGKVLGSKSEN